MAIWHFKIQLIPRQWAELNHFNTDSLFRPSEYDHLDETIDTEPAWRENQPDQEIGRVIEKYYRPSKSWCDEILIWGSKHESDVQVLYEAGKIEEFEIRIDLRQCFEDDIENATEIANTLSCMMLVPGAKIIVEPNKSILEKLALKSNAGQYVCNPRKFLEKFRKET